MREHTSIPWWSEPSLGPPLGVHAIGGPLATLAEFSSNNVPRLEHLVGVGSNAIAGAAVVAGVAIASVAGGHHLVAQSASTTPVTPHATSPRPGAGRSDRSGKGHGPSRSPMAAAGQGAEGSRTGPTSTSTVGADDPGPGALSATVPSAPTVVPASTPSLAVVPATTPGAPTGVTVAGGNGQVWVSWNPPDGNGGSPIIGYLVIPYLDGTRGSPITYLSTTTTEVISGLTNGDSYTFAVEALNAEGAGPPSLQSSPVTPTSVPGVPRDLTGVAGNGQVSLTWTAPIDDGGTPITGYTVTPYDGGVPGSPIGYSSTTTSETVSGLTNGSAYTFTVEAQNADGNSGASVQSSSFTPSTLPSAATGVTATGGNGQVTLSWTAPAQDGGTPIDGYIVNPYIGSTAQSWSLFVSSDTTETVTGLANGTAYTFTVQAINGAGTGPASSPTAPVTPSTVPAAPFGVVAMPGDGQALLDWTPPSQDGGSPVTGYVVTPYEAGIAQRPDTFASAATTEAVTGLTNGTTYTFTVAASHLDGTGSDSVPSAAVTPAALAGAPTGLSAASGDGQATLSWVAPVDDGGTPVTGYVVTPLIGGVTQTPIVLTSTATTDTVTGLTNGITYTFAVAATNAMGTGPDSIESAGVTPATVPGAPTGVSGTGGLGEVVLSWTAPSDGGSPITSYTVTPSLLGIALTPTTYASSATSQTVTGLLLGSLYTFTVTATNAVGTGPSSASSAGISPT